MRVKVLYFGILKDKFGVAEELVELPGEGSVGELIELLRGRASNSVMSKEAGGADERLWRSLAVAVNREYALLPMVLHEGDEVALLPPVSGGLLRCYAHGERLASFAKAGVARRGRGLLARETLLFVRESGGHAD